MTYLHMFFMLNFEHVYIKQTIVNKDIETMLCCLKFIIIYRDIFILINILYIVCSLALFRKEINEYQMTVPRLHP